MSSSSVSSSHHHQHREAKRAKTREAELSTSLGYTNESNPFGDSNLTSTFRWKKKEQFQEAAGVRPLKASEAREQARVNLNEVVQIRQRREERAAEESLLEQQRSEREREIMEDEYRDWLAKEEMFDISQAALRCSLRIKTNTEHLEDYLYKELLLASKGVEKYPYDDCTILESPLVTDTIASLPPSELATSAVHIGDLERAARDRGRGEEADYWHCVLALVKEQLAAKTEAGPKLAPTSGLGVEDASIEGLLGDIQSAEVLRGVEDELKWLLNSKDTGGPAEEVDEEFITAALEKIPHYVSRLRVDDIHRKARKVVEKVAASMEDEEEEEENKRRAVSPVPIDRGTSALEPITEEASRSEMVDMRRKIVEQWNRTDRSAKAEANLLTAAEKRLLAEERNRKVDDGDVTEEMFNELYVDPGEANKTYAWENKYRPRKPKFYNKVKTGFDWNKYNQTHYDKETPPPKRVMGYRFNILYPDLIDMRKTPQYHQEASPTPGTIILRFSAGPPYEDIAFKIANKEWDYDRRSGFKAAFERGMLQLHFNFKRDRYRR
ncbi:conserved hypothetical protein [Perkinsus marinus ATCC 50983]|uniref:Splicing factor Cactin n=2 Tax=Perkinsus marinus (strain ATCC 50983 / TXsc) TaxID=423536 RepID=C5LCH2_PERM5|nr:conserved hypothetical protein [Perkinsus marinus ATCC 50983]EER05655.1 conserved hypothetical protein [Perkinsus marinus ATCC 50983]|eukprot:XP_002773839.1 conserved hypothetical protein [Perkinsus marinus ATCC 50983]